MGLKDEIIEQKQKAKAQAKLEAETAARERSQKFAELKDNYEKGIVPQEWMDLYDKYSMKIREWFSENTKDFSCREPITEEFYRSKADFGNGTISELTLMNKYLTKRLQNDGFEDAIFELVEETETYLTSQDVIRQQEAQAEANRRNMDNYHNALWNEASKDAGVGDLNSVKMPPITTVFATATGKRQVYNIIVECSIDDSDSEETPPKNKVTGTDRSSEIEAPVKGVKLWRKRHILTFAGICAVIGLVTAIAMVFTVSLLEMFIPIFAAMGFVYGLLFALIIRYIKLAIHCRIFKYYTAISKHIVKAVLCAIALGGAIALGVIVVPMLM